MDNLEIKDKIIVGLVGVLIIMLLITNINTAVTKNAILNQLEVIDGKIVVTQENITSLKANQDEIGRLVTGVKDLIRASWDDINTIFEDQDGWTQVDPDDLDTDDGWEINER